MSGQEFFQLQRAIENQVAADDVEAAGHDPSEVWVDKGDAHTEIDVQGETIRLPVAYQEFSITHPAACFVRLAQVVRKPNGELWMDRDVMGKIEDEFYAEDDHDQ